MLRAWRDTDDNAWFIESDRYASLEKVPSPVRERLAILLTAPDGYRDERVGRRVSSDTFWVAMNN